MDRCYVISWIFVGCRRNSLLSVNLYDCSFVEPENVRDNAGCREIETCSRQGKMLSIVYWSIGPTALWYMCNKGVKYVETSSNASTQEFETCRVSSALSSMETSSQSSHYTPSLHTLLANADPGPAHRMQTQFWNFLCFFFNFDCITGINFKSQHALAIACILFSTLNTNTEGMCERASEQTPRHKEFNRAGTTHSGSEIPGSATL